MHQVNPVFRPAFATDARYRIIYGGAGSSKSVSTAQDFVRRAGSTGDVRVLVVRKVYRTCRNSTFKLCWVRAPAPGSLNTESDLIFSTRSCHFFGTAVGVKVLAHMPST